MVYVLSCHLFLYKCRFLGGNDSLSHFGYCTLGQKIPAFYKGQNKPGHSQIYKFFDDPFCIFLPNLNYMARYKRDYFFSACIYQVSLAGYMHADSCIIIQPTHESVNCILWLQSCGFFHFPYRKKIYFIYFPFCKVWEPGSQVEGPLLVTCHQPVLWQLQPSASKSSVLQDSYC